MSISGIILTKDERYELVGCRVMPAENKNDVAILMVVLADMKRK